MSMQIQTVHSRSRHHELRRAPKLHLSLARNECEIREAQRLRYKIFGEEWGARLSERIPGHDTDLFDSYCEHMLVRDQNTGKVIATYRTLAPEAARSAGSYYSEETFSLTRLQHIRPCMMEIGRFCIHADYRNSTVMPLLWSGLGNYLASRGCQYMIGCLSISMADGGRNAANLYQQLTAEQQAPLEYRGFPFQPLPFKHLANGQPARVPPLIKGYLHAGGLVCSEPAWDADFNTADLLLLLPVNRLSARYGQHFLNPHLSINASDKNKIVL